MELPTPGLKQSNVFFFFLINLDNVGKKFSCVENLIVIKKYSQQPTYFERKLRSNKQDPFTWVSEIVTRLNERPLFCAFM